MQCRRLVLLCTAAAFALANGARAQQAPDQIGAGVSPVQSGQAQPSPPVGYQDIPGLSPGAQRAVKNLIPFTPEMLTEIERRVGAAKEAAEKGVLKTAFPVSRLINVAYSPGAATSIIQTVQGYPTAISFFDRTGAPWPIDWNTNSNAANVGGGTNCNSTPTAGSGGGSPSVTAVGFYICVPVKGSNTLEITPLSQVPRGGLVLSLEKSPKPITFLLIAGNNRYDSDLSVHVSDAGPNAKVLVDTRPNAPSTGTPFLNELLAGIPPADARPQSVSGSGVSPDEIRAWRIGQETYIRTRYRLMTPPWDGVQHGEDGVTIYAIRSVPVVLLQAEGHTVSAQIEDER